MKKILISVGLLIAGAIVGSFIFQANVSNLGSASGRDLYNYQNISSVDAGKIMVVRSNSAILGSLVIASSSSAGEIIIYDNSSATGVSTTTVASSTATKISRIKVGTAENTLTYDVLAPNGIVLGIPSTFNGNYTLTWK